MTKKFLILLAVALLAMGTLVLTGCDDDDDDTTVVAAPTLEPFVHGVIFSAENNRKVTSRSEAYITVTNYPVMPAVTVNGQTLALEPEMTVYGGGAGFMGDFEPSDENMAVVNVAFDADHESGTVTLPTLGANEIVGDDDIAMTPVESQTVSWTAAENVDAYWISVDYDGNYQDSEGASHSWYHEFSVITTDTFLTITPEQWLPAGADVDSVTSFWGDIDVMAVNGPIQPGDAPNVTGGCDGFVLGMGSELDWDLYLESGPLKTPANDREQEIDWFQRYVEMMR